jgi:hypothetical protein
MMEIKNLPLEISTGTKFTRIVQLVFGALCIIIGAFWMIFNFKSLRADTTLWITVSFLFAFGAYQIFAGLGKIKKYIEFRGETIILRQNSFLPAVEFKSAEIVRIDIYPLSIQFILEKKKRFILRFGLSNTEVIDPIKNAVMEFSATYNVPCEEKREEL